MSDLPQTLWLTIHSRPKQEILLPFHKNVLMCLIVGIYRLPKNRLH